MGATNDIKDILRGALASLLGFGGRLLARLSLMVVAGQLYGAVSLGLLGQVAAITEILAAIAVFGLKRSLLDMLSADNAGGGSDSDALRLIKEALVSSLIVAALLSALFGMCWPLLFPNDTMPLLLYLAIPCIVIAEVGGTAIRYKRVIRWEVIARGIMEPWAFFIAALVFYTLGFSKSGLISGYAISAAGAAVGIAIGLNRAFGLRKLLGAKIRLSALYQIPIKSLPVGITDIGIMGFRRLDILVLSLVAGHQVTGIYYMAQQIVTVPHKVYQLFEPMMAPVLAKLHHQSKSKTIGAKLAGFCRWVFTIQLAITVPFILFSGELMGVFGSQFAAGALVLGALLIAELLDGSFALTEIALVFAKPKVPPKLILMALAIELAAIYVLAARWGAEGAAIGYLVAMASLACARLFMLKKHLGISIIGRAFLVPISFGIVIATALTIVRSFWPMTEAIMFGPAIIISIVLFMGSVRLLALTSDDKLILQQLKTAQR